MMSVIDRGTYYCGFVFDIAKAAGIGIQDNPGDKAPDELVDECQVSLTRDIEGIEATDSTRGTLECRLLLSYALGLVETLNELYARLGSLDMRHCVGTPFVQSRANGSGALLVGMSSYHHKLRSGLYLALRRFGPKISHMARMLDTEYRGLLDHGGEMNPFLFSPSIRRISDFSVSLEIMEHMMNDDIWE